MKEQSQTEKWNKIPNFFNYSVSNLGQVRNDLTGRILQQSNSYNSSTSNKSSYKQVLIRRNNKAYCCKVHSLVMLAFTDYEQNKGLTIDHIDHNTFNNHLSNLRILTKSGNNKNRNKDNTSSKYEGVTYYKQINRWGAYSFSICKKSIYLGVYKTEHEAYLAKQEYEEMLYSK